MPGVTAGPTAVFIGTKEKIMADSPTELMRVEISAGRDRAWLIVEPAALKTAWDVAELNHLAQAAGLPAGPELEQRFAELKDPATRTAGASQFEIAHATPPLAALSASLLLTLSSGMVKAGAVLGQIEPARPGRDGVDVLGEPIPHGSSVDQMPTVPPGMRLESGTLIAERDGYFHSEGPLSKIDLVSEVPALDAFTFSINFDRTTLVRGNIRKSVGVTALQSLIVDGSADASVITVAYDMHVQGVFGREFGRYTVGRDLRATFLRQANVIVGGNLYVEQDIVESDVVCSGRVILPEGEIRGGRVHAESGLEVKTIGDSFSKTVIEIGLDIAFDKLLEKKRNAILAARKHVEQVRLHIAPLMSNPKRLTNQQKEKATELLFEADELQAKIESDLAELRKSMQIMQTRAQSSLVVQSAIYAGTTIRFQGVETTVRSTIQGPVRIVAIDFNTRPRIVAFRGTNPTPQTLESRGIQHNVFAELKRLAA